MALPVGDHGPGIGNPNASGGNKAWVLLGVLSHPPRTTGRGRAVAGPRHPRLGDSKLQGGRCGSGALVSGGSAGGRADHAVVRSAPSALPLLSVGHLLASGNKNSISWPDTEPSAPPIS